jgi:hypothetical protein
MHGTGRRQRLADKIVNDLSGAWEEWGAGVLTWLAKNDRATFAKLAIANLPKDILVSVDQRIPGGLDLEEWAVLRRVLGLIKECAPHGTSALEVFQVNETALRAHYAKQIGD